MTDRRLLHPGTYDGAPGWPGKDRDHLAKLIAFIASQIVLLFLLFQTYKMARKTFIQRAERVAYDHAVDILHLEGRLDLDFELDLQQWVLRQPDWVIRIFNNFYAYYMYVFYACFIVAMFFAVDRWRYHRRWFLISMLIATPIYAIYPLAPPRFMEPFGWNFVDTLAVYGPNYFSENGLVTANRYAAMPSMHVGWTTLAAISLASCLPWRRTGRVIAIALIAMITLTVIVTGNHYWLDAVGGWIVIGAAALINRALPYPLPIRWPWARTAPQTAPQKPGHSAKPVFAKPLDMDDSLRYHD